MPNNIRQIGLATLNFEATAGAFPEPASTSGSTAATITAS